MLTATPPGHTKRRTIAVRQFECMSFNFECQDAWWALVPSGMEPKEKDQYLTLDFFPCYPGG